MGQSEVKTIVAVSTPAGVGGISVIRISGPEAVTVLGRAWTGKNPEDFKSHTVHLGWLKDEEGVDIDQVVATLFKAPNSYTGEDVVEISCHGSPWIQKAIVTRLIQCGAMAAGAGEFTRRAFMNGRLDLAQADGVADMISANSKAAARLAASYMKGDFSRKLEEMRSALLDLGVLLELELDFSEEDVEFADRGRLIKLATELLEMADKLAGSFKAGSAFKEGIPVAIAGIPNAGKSTLLNALLQDEKAIVSDIPGTTRDIIEDTVEIDGLLFRFIDTAGLRDSDDTIEQIGIERALKRIKNAAILLYLIDVTQDLDMQISRLKQLSVNDDLKVLPAYSKTEADGRKDFDHKVIENAIDISVAEGKGVNELKGKLVELATADYNPANEMVITNARHYEALLAAKAPLERLLEGLQSGVSADFLAQDIREANSHLGEITGAVTSDEILHSIFARYCIGK